MRIIKYSKQWDKVKPKNRVVPRQFTTARGYTPSKETYYRGEIGNHLIQEVKGVNSGVAKLLSIEVCRSSDKDISFWKLDTFNHYTMRDIRAEFKSMYRNEDPMVIVLHLVWMAVQERL